MTKVAGKNSEHDVKVFTLSTCGWCKKMKKLLNTLEIEYEYFDLDLAEGEEREQIRTELKKYNPNVTTPTVVVDDGKEVIVGFDEEKVRRCFSNGG
jgi:glutaredoxin